MNNEHVPNKFPAKLISALIFPLAKKSLFVFNDKIKDEIMNPDIENAIWK